MIDEPTLIAILAAVAASALTGLASALLLGIEWRRETAIRREERRLEASERLLDAVDLLRSQASHSGPTETDMQGTKNRIALHAAVLRKYGIPPQVETAIKAIEDALPGVNTLPSVGARIQLDDAAAVFAQVVVDELASP